jgi:C-terminal processing protease CtpA/Prc
MKDVLNKIGLSFEKEKVSYDFTFGGVDLNFNEITKRLFVEDTGSMDECGKALGYKRGDEIYKLNGQEMVIERAKDIVTDYYKNLKEGDKITVEVYRPKKRKDKYKLVTLTATARKVKVVRTNQLTLNPDVTEEQGATLKSWMGL